MHGSLLLLGAYTIARLTDLDRLRAGPVPGGRRDRDASALLVERLLINRLRGAPVISLAILTIGIDIMLLTELTRRIGSDILNVGHPWGGDRVRFGAVGITENRLYAMVGPRSSSRGFFAAFKFSSWGVAMRATRRGRRDGGADGHPARPGAAPPGWSVPGLAPSPGCSLLVRRPRASRPACRRWRCAPSRRRSSAASTRPAAPRRRAVIGIAEAMPAGYQDQLLFLAAASATSCRTS